MHPVCFRTGLLTFVIDNHIRNVYERSIKVLYRGEFILCNIDYFIHNFWSDWLPFVSKLSDVAILFEQALDMAIRHTRL